MTEMDWALVLLTVLAGLNLVTLLELRRANEGWRAAHGAWMASDTALKIFGVQLELERLREAEDGEIPAAPEPDRALH
jgi:hypothetical protein